MSNRPRLSMADPSDDSLDASDAADERTVRESETSWDKYGAVERKSELMLLEIGCSCSGRRGWMCVW